MTKDEQVERALRISRQMRSSVSKPMTKSKLVWEQFDCREECCALVGGKLARAQIDAPPDRED